MYAGIERRKSVILTSANSDLRMTKTAFTTLINEGHLEENPFSAMKNIKMQKKQIDTLSDNELTQLLNSLDKSWFADFHAYVLIHVLLDSFRRISEVLALKKQDIDFEHSSITFNETKIICLELCRLQRRVESY